MKTIGSMEKKEFFMICIKRGDQFMYSGEILWQLINAFKNYSSFFFYRFPWEALKIPEYQLTK